MAKRLILVLGVMAVLITALGFAKFRQIESAVHAGAFPARFSHLRRPSPAL